MTIEGLHYVKRCLANGDTRWHVYAWRGGPSIYSTISARKPKLPKEALDAYQDAHKALAADTFEGMARAFRQSPEWANLAKNTKRNWHLVLDKLEAKWGETPAKLWSDPRMVSKVVAYRNTLANTPRTADYHITVLNSLLSWARLSGHVTVNVAAGIPKLYKGGNRQEIIWTAEDRAKMAAYPNRAVADAVELACLTGLRLADLAALKWSEIGQHAIVRVAEKASKGKRRRATVPLYAALSGHLEALRGRPRREGVETVLTTGDGKAWSSGGLGKRVGEARDKLGIVHTDGRPKHLHDCRGTFATELMRCGLTDNEIADIMAWAPDKIATIRKVYVDDAQTVVAIGRRIAGVNGPVNGAGGKA